MTNNRGHSNRTQRHNHHVRKRVLPRPDYKPNRRKSSIDIDKLAATFWNFQFCNCQNAKAKRKRGRPPKDETAQIRELLNRNLNNAQIVDILAESKFVEITDDFVSEGFELAMAKRLAQAEIKVWKERRKDSVRALRKYYDETPQSKDRRKFKRVNSAEKNR